MGPISQYLYAAGSGGAVIHYDGTQWTDLISPIKEDIYGIWGSQDNDIYVRTVFAQVYHYDGSNWTKVFQKTALSFHGIFGLAQNEVFTVGENNTVYEYDGLNWSIKLSENLISPDINGVLGFSDTNIFAVGNDGKVFNYNGTNWSEMKSGVYENFNCVWGISSTSLFVYLIVCNFQ